MQTQNKLIAAMLGVVIVALLFVEGFIIPKELQPDALPLRFVGYNNPELMTATFEMENQSGSPVIVWEYAVLITHIEGEESQQGFELERTQIPDKESRRLTVPVARSNDWRIELNVARFGESEQKRFDAGKAVKGTVVYSDLVLHDPEAKPTAPIVEQ